MMRLILMRHAKAVREHEAPSDKARPLTERGQREAREAGDLLRAQAFIPARILVSTAQRTRDTHAQLGFADISATFLDGLYMAPAEHVFAAAVTPDDSADTLVIAHNPGLGELTQRLIAVARDNSKLARTLAGHFPTAAFAAFEIDGLTIEASGARFVGGWAPDRS
jgi:phosphohistidine phosphatase